MSIDYPDIYSADFSAPDSAGFSPCKGLPDKNIEYSFGVISPLIGFSGIMKKRKGYGDPKGKQGNG